MLSCHFLPYCTCVHIKTVWVENVSKCSKIYLPGWIHEFVKRAKGRHCTWVGGRQKIKFSFRKITCSMNIFQSHNCINMYIVHYIVLCTNSPTSSSANEMMNLWWWFIRPGKEQVLVSPIHTFFSFQLPNFLSSSRAINRLNRNKSLNCHCSQTYFKKNSSDRLT